jgi:hypothetical protein
MSAPTAPLIDIRPEVGFSSILFYWRPPASDGGSPVLYYTLDCPAISFTANISTTADTYLVDNLARTTDFTFTMTATNANGTGPAATYRTVQTGLIPFGPTQATASTLTSSIAYLTWNLSTLATNEATPKWFVVTISPSTPTMSSFKRCAYIYERAKTFTVPSTNIAYQFLVQAVADPGYCVPFAYTSSLLFGSPAPFSPSTISGMRAWYDAQDTNYFTMVGTTSTVSSILDKSGQGFTLSNPLGVTRGVQKFNGTYNSFYEANDSGNNRFGSNASFTVSQPFTLVTLAQASNINQWHILMDSPTAAGRVIYYYDNNNALWTLNAGNDVRINYDIRTTPSSLLVAYYSTTNSFVYMNGSTTVSNANVGTTNMTNGICLGKHPTVSFNYTGHLCEFMIYNRVLTLTERQQVEGYVAWKWGINGALPSNHPYRNAPP